MNERFTWWELIGLAIVIAVLFFVSIVFQFLLLIFFGIPFAFVLYRYRTYSPKTTTQHRVIS